MHIYFISLYKQNIYLSTKTKQIELKFVIQNKQTIFWYNFNIIGFIGCFRIVKDIQKARSNDTYFHIIQQ